MSCLGVHFSLDEATAQKRRGLPNDVARRDLLLDIEADYFANHPQWLQETGKVWDGLHRALTDGNFDWSNGAYPLNHVVMGGERLYFPSDHIMTLKNPQQVRDTTEALKGVTKEELRAGYLLINSQNCDGGPSDEDFESTWEYFPPLRDFFQRAAEANRWVLFSASQ